MGNDMYPQRLRVSSICAVLREMTSTTTVAAAISSSSARGRASLQTTTMFG
jgi:hypothetical protein